MVGAITVATFVVLLLLGIPIAFAIGVASIVGLLLLGLDAGIVVSQQIYDGLRSFPLVAIPMFLLMANLMEVGGITNALVRFANSLIGHVRGSLAIGNVTASTFFAGISGSSLADTTAVGSIMIPAMVKQGYPPAFAGAVTAAANIVGPIIPPSILMILYGFAAQQSVISLFLGGIIPGLMLSLTFALFAFWLSNRRRYGYEEARFSLKSAAAALVLALPALAIPVIIVTGVVGGVFTITESAAGAAVYALLFCMVGGAVRGKVPWLGMLSAFQKTALDTAVVLILVGGSHLLAWVLTVSQMPQAIASVLDGLGRFEMLAIINIILLVFGMFLEPAASVLLAASLLIPAVQAAGVDLVHFGIIVVVNLQLGILTPPVASAAFVTSRIAGISFEQQIGTLLPFLGLGFITLILVTYFPPLSLFIPNLVLE